ncbi:MAG: DUF5916 domain-containing protein [Bacteroidales bacterium]|jgi:hypothetical protein
MKSPFLIIFTLFLFIALKSGAQHSMPDTLKAHFAFAEITLDGKLNETEWSSAQIISNFKQRELIEGADASEKTEVSVIFTRNAIYLGIRCHDSDPNRIVARYLQRDFDWGSDDSFETIISPFNDKRNGYLFIINPNGARADVQITNEGEYFNVAWNGVWDAVATINENGWFAEVCIPFSTLQFPDKSEQSWGINFERNIRRKNEQVLWQGWSRNYEIENISQSGTLSGLENIKGQLRWEVKPYALGGVASAPEKKPDYLGKIGLDINKNLLSTLKLNLTINTDFAQVESDRIQVNLSRFSIYYPEKRDFFLEGAGNYEFSLANNSRLFHSRTIGINNFNLLPVLGGARVFGKVSKTNIGFLSLQTASRDSIPSTNYSVIRIRQDIGEQSSIGFITTSNINKNSSSQTFGVDGKYVTSRFLKDKNLVIGGAFAGSMTKGNNTGNNLAYLLYAEYPNDLLSVVMGVSAIEKNFNPEMGYLSRSNYRQFFHEFEFTPRWFTRYGVRQMEFKLYELDFYWNDQTGKLESYNMDFSPLGFSLQSGEWFEFTIQKKFDSPPEPFDLSDNIMVPVGDYHMTNFEINAGTSESRKLYSYFNYEWGDFYTGKGYSFSVETAWNLNKHINLAAEYTYNDINLPQGDLYTNEFAGRIRYAFNTKLNVSLFSQWNSEEDFIGFNFKIHWIPKIGSDFYFVINQNYEERISYRTMQQTNAAAKLVWRFAF